MFHGNVDVNLKVGDVIQSNNGFNNKITVSLVPIN